MRAIRVFPNRMGRGHGAQGRAFAQRKCSVELLLMRSATQRVCAMVCVVVVVQPRNVYTTTTLCADFAPPVRRRDAHCANNCALLTPHSAPENFRWRVVKKNLKNFTAERHP